MGPVSGKNLFPDLEVKKAPDLQHLRRLFLFIPSSNIKQHGNRIAFVDRYFIYSINNCNYHCNREEPLEEPEEVSQTEWEEWVGRSRAQRGLHISWSGKFFFQDEEED
jgi:hypothetical protein